jgi:hypothetical protein
MKIGRRVIERTEWSQRRGRPPYADHVDLWRWRLEIGFLFRILSLINDMAKQTRMGTIKGLSDCLT